MEYIRDISKKKNDKAVVLYGKKKRDMHSEGKEDHLQTLHTQQKKIKIAPSSNLFPSKVGGMTYPLKKHVVLSLLTTAKAWAIS